MSCLCFIMAREPHDQEFWGGTFVLCHSYAAAGPSLCIFMEVLGGLCVRKRCVISIIFCDAFSGVLSSLWVVYVKTPLSLPMLTQQLLGVSHCLK